MSAVGLQPDMIFTMGKDSVTWRILSVDQDTVLAITEETICSRVYHERNENITWDQCALRKWLNGEYFETAFSPEEQAAMMDCLVVTGENGKYLTKGGDAAMDRIYLLSLEEAEKYFKDNQERSCSEWWWLRSSGYEQNLTAVVKPDGSIYDYGNYASFEAGVRPVVALKLEFVLGLVS